MKKQEDLKDIAKEEEATLHKFFMGLCIAGREVRTLPVPPTTGDELEEVESPTLNLAQYKTELDVVMAKAEKQQVAEWQVDHASKGVVWERSH